MNNFSIEEVKHLMSRATTQYEVERRFLLKKVPQSFLDNAQKIEIVNFYLTNEETKNGPTISRIRIQKENGVKKIIKTNKTPIGLEFAQQEIEVELTAVEFEKYMKSITQYIKKIRYKLDIRGKTWEVDDFLNINLVIAELEESAVNALDAKRVEDKLKKINIPNIIKQHLIAEVTGDHQFSNLALSEPLNSSVQDMLIDLNRLV